ncbi:hypothetical protein MLD38_030975 [Melastoma candidum]|uniref:Uncharacterized protein n=1 Tax=Melastoma candidum TaxID=119954 RepID=A0ACB9MPV5_9MYRT|nr:hypothetical protein MLD38_030975 [Melastoma candidum]
MGVGSKISRLLVKLIRGGCRSVRNHPLLVGMACWLFLLYRSSPWLFSLLVSVSPVLVCTALLLGMLLSLGQPNIPEIEREEGAFSHEIVPLKTSLCERAPVVAQIEHCSLESISCEKKKEAKERVVDGADGVIEKNDDLCENAYPVVDTSRDIQFDRTCSKEDVIEKSDTEEENSISVHDEKIAIESVSWSRKDRENRYRLIEEEVSHTIEVENGKNEREASDDHQETRSESKWKEVDEGDNEDDDGGDNEDDVSMDSGSEHAESSDSGSEHAESSSPDASMADIRPMLDELHPLLDEEELLVSVMTHENSDVGSEHSDRSKSENMESDDDSKNGDDDNADDLEEEEAQGGKEDESETAITWTADDQKNIMDLGTLELERNQRLENLIARRRARKNKGLMDEKSLIDLDYIDLPFNVAHIATMRQNPFDGADDSYNNMGLPPVPGSAPSVLLKRRNPFDLPYEPNEEKPDLKGDSFQQEFTTHHQRDGIFCRHESFAVGPSHLGIYRKEKQVWRPYFVPEHFVSDEPNDHPIQRQLSEVTESKASSEPDTESVTSVMDQDNKNTNELDSSREAESVSCLDQDSPCVEHGTESSEHFKSTHVEEVDKDISLRDENVIMLGNIESQDESESSYSEAMTNSLDSNSNESPTTADTVEPESIQLAETQDEPESSYSEAMTASLDSNTDGSPSTADSVEPELMLIMSGSAETKNEPELMLIMSGSAETKNEPESGYSEGMNASLDSNRDGSLLVVNTVEPKSMLIRSGNAETQDEPDSNYSEAKNASLASNTDGSPSTAYTVDEESSSKSSSSFYSEVNESVTDVKREENSRPAVDVDAKNHFTNEHEVEDVNFSLPRETVDDSRHNEPVYDSSPPAIERFHSFSQFPSDMHAGMVEVGPTPGLVENASVKTERESLHENTPDHEVFSSASLLQAENGNRSINQETTEVIKTHMFGASPAQVHGETSNQNGPETSILLVSTSSSSSSYPSSGESTPERRIHQLDPRDEHVNVHLPNSAVEGFDEADHPLREHQDGFISVGSLNVLEISKQQRLPSSGIEHESTFDVDLGTKDGVDFVEVVTTEQGGTHACTTNGPVQEGMESNVNNVQEDIQVEQSVYSSDGHEDDSLIQEVHLDAANQPSQKVSSRLEEGNSIVNEELSPEGNGADEDDTREILERGVMSLSDILTTSPHSITTSDGTLEFASPTGTLYYSDDSVRGVGFVTRDRVLKYSAPTEEASEIGGDVRVKVTSDKSADADLAPLAIDRADGNDSPYHPSEMDEARLTEDASLASVPLHKGEDADAQMVSGSRNLDHRDVKDRVEENSGSSETRYVEVEKTSDDIVEFSQADHSNDLPVMEADEVTSSGHVHTSNELASVLGDTEMIESSGLESNSSLPVLEARSVEDINMVFEQFCKGANVEEKILPSSPSDNTGKDEPLSVGKTSPSFQDVEPMSLNHIKKMFADEDDQKPADMHSIDRLAEYVAGDVNSAAEATDANDAESDFGESRNASFEKAGSLIELESTSSTAVHEATSRGDIGTTSGPSQSQANAEDDVHPPVSSDLIMEELGGRDVNGSTTRDAGSSEPVRLPEVHVSDAPAIAETAQEVAADNVKYIALEPDPHKIDSSNNLLPNFER